MYVDYEYYSKKYGGTIPEELFSAQVRKAEACIRYLTYVNGDVFGKESEVIKQAVCAAADVYHTDVMERGNRTAEGKAGAVKSESNDGYSVSYVTEQQEGQTAEELVRKKVYEAVYPYLLPAGWLSRRVRYEHAHKCGYNGL